jgi:hypothetical protein
MRAAAAEVAERVIVDFANGKENLSEPATKARFERLYGENAKLSDIKLDAEGRLDINDAANRLAVSRWTMDAIMTPNAASKPIYGSDPRYQMFMHLKTFTYTFHRMLLRGAIQQAALGNYRPMAMVSSGMIAAFIAAGIMKEMLIPGDDPLWVKKGLPGYLEYGWMRSTLLGVPQDFYQNPTGVAGPTVWQMTDVLSIPFGDKGLWSESVAALPGGGTLRRYAR